MVELVRSGNLGPVAAVRTFNVQNQMPDGIGHAPPTPAPAGFDWDLWCGPAPLRPFNPILAENSFNHCSWMDYSGGWTPGMAPHLIDLPIWALDLGFPLKTSCTGGRYFLKDDGDAYDNHEVLWQYPHCTVTWMSSLTNSYGFDFEGDPVPKRRLGTYFHGANGTIAADYGTLKLIPEGDKMKGLEAPPKSIPPSPGHEREWLDCIKSRQQPACNPVVSCARGCPHPAQPALPEAGPLDQLRPRDGEDRRRLRSRPPRHSQIPRPLEVPQAVPQGLKLTRRLTAGGASRDDAAEHWKTYAPGP